MTQKFHFLYVRICNPNGEDFIGCGFRVTQKHVVTCCHVLKTVTESSQICVGDEFEANLPFVETYGMKLKLLHFYHENDQPRRDEYEDLALLEWCNYDESKEITDPSLDWFSFSDPDSSTELKIYCGQPATVEALKCNNLNAEGRFSLTADSIEKIGEYLLGGDSGSPVWISKNNRTIGMVVAKNSNLSICYVVPVSKIFKAFNEYLKLENKESIVRDFTREEHATFKTFDNSLACSPDFMKLLVQRKLSKEEQNKEQIEREKQDLDNQMLRNTPLHHFTRMKTGDPNFGHIFSESKPFIDRVEEFFQRNEGEKNKILIILGGPGEGKTTTVSHLVWYQNKKTDSKLIPYFFSLKDFQIKTYTEAGVTEKFASFLAKSPKDLESNWPDSSWWEKKLNSDGGLLLVMDGLDEFAPEDKDKEPFLNELKKWADKGNSIVVTCRDNTYYQLTSNFFNDPEVWKLNGWEPNSREWRKYIDDYPGRNNKAAKSLLKLKLNDPSLEDLPLVPFILDLLCFVTIGPEDTISKFNLIQKGILRLISNRLGGSKDEALKIIDQLARVAIMIQSRQPGENRFTKEEFKNYVAKTNNIEDSSSDEFINILIDARLISLPKQPHPELTDDRIRGSFTHNIILEYLSAKGLCLKSKNNFPDIEDKIQNPDWHGTLCFVPGHMDDPKCFFNNLLNGQDNILRIRVLTATRGLVEVSRGLRDEDKEWAEILARKCWLLMVEYHSSANQALVALLLDEMAAVFRMFDSPSKHLQGMLSSKSRTTREKAYAVALEIGRPLIDNNNIIEQLFENLKTPDWNESKRIGDVLSNIGQTIIGKLLESFDVALEEQNWSLAEVIVGILGSIKTYANPEDLQKVEKVLLNSVKDDKHWPLHVTACKAISSIFKSNADQELVDLLITYTHIGDASLTLTDPIHILREFACEALGKIKVGKSDTIIKIIIPHLRSLVNDPIPSVNQVALSSLAKRVTILSAGEIQKLIINLIESPIHHEKEQGCNLLGRFSNSKNIILKNAIETKQVMHVLTNLLLEQEMHDISTTAACEAIAQFDTKYYKEFSCSIVEKLNSYTKCDHYNLVMAASKLLVRILLETNLNQLLKIISEIENEGEREKKPDWMRSARIIDEIGKSDFSVNDAEVVLKKLKDILHISNPPNWELRYGDIRDAGSFYEAANNPNRIDLKVLIDKLDNCERSKIELETQNTQKLYSINPEMLVKSLNSLIEGDTTDWIPQENLVRYSKRFQWLVKAPTVVIEHNRDLRRSLLDSICYKEILQYRTDGEITISSIRAIEKLISEHNIDPGEIVKSLMKCLYRKEWYVPEAVLVALKTKRFRDVIARKDIYLKQIHFCLTAPESHLKVAAFHLVAKLLTTNKDYQNKVNKYSNELLRFFACLVDQEENVREKCSNIFSALNIGNFDELRCDFLYDDLENQLTIQLTYFNNGPHKVKMKLMEGEFPRLLPLNLKVSYDTDMFG